MKWMTVSAALLFCCAATSDANAFFHHGCGCGCAPSCCAPAPSCCCAGPELLRSGPDVLRSGSCCRCSQLLRSGPDGGSFVLRSGCGSVVLRSGS